MAEQEKVRSLEAELARVRQEAIADFKASPEFDDLLAAEYDASFSETFKSCWERIIEEVGAQIEGVTLERFPVPKSPGEETPSPRAVVDLGESHPVDSQDGEVPTEDPMIEDPKQAKEDLGEDAEAQDEAQDQEAHKKEAQEQEKDQEDFFDDGLP